MTNQQPKDKLAKLVVKLRQSCGTWPDESDLVACLKTHQKVLADVATIKHGKNKGKPKYVYDSAALPPLDPSRIYSNAIPTEPTSLAEALLWKMGKWPTYKKFVESYSGVISAKEKEDDTDSKFVVYHGFALFLRSHHQDPIIDQHSFRALWAISNVLTAEETGLFRDYLFESNESWKESGSSDDAEKCREMYVKKVLEVSKGDLEIQAELDKLLMPLGQALKVISKGIAKDHNKSLKKIDKENRPTLMTHFVAFNSLMTTNKKHSSDD